MSRRVLHLSAKNGRQFNFARLLLLPLLIILTLSTSISCSAEYPDEDSQQGMLKFSFLNYDETQWPNFEVWIRGIGSFKPDLESGEVIENVSGFIPGNSYPKDFAIYPDGRNGQEIYVPLKIPSDLISNSTKDTIQIWIEDNELVVFGSSIVGLEQKFKLN